MIASAPASMASNAARRAPASLVISVSGNTKLMNVYGAAWRMSNANLRVSPIQLPRSPGESDRKFRRPREQRTFIVSIPAASAAAASSGRNGRVSTSCRTPLRSRMLLTVWFRSP